MLIIRQRKNHGIPLCSSPPHLPYEIKDVIFIDNPASCGCPAVRFRDYLDCKSCHTKKMAIDRTGDVCNKGCGVDLGIRQHLLGTTKEWMILKCYTCSKCKTGKRCAVEGCDKFPQTGCNGHCLGHATQEQKDEKNEEKRKTGKRCAVEGCDKLPQQVAMDIAWAMRHKSRRTQ